MKKFLSVVLLLAMLVGCVVPAMVASAAGEAAVVSIPKNVDAMAGDNVVSVPVTLADLPCDLGTVSVVLFWSADYSVEEVGYVADATVIDMENSGAGAVYAGSNKNLKTILTPYNAATKSFNGSKVDIFAACDEDEAYIPFTSPCSLGEIQIVLTDELSVGDTFEFQWALIDACNVDDETVESLDAAAYSCTATAKADPLVGLYEEPTLFINPASAEVEAGESFTFDVRVDANPGIWGGAYYMVYPNNWSITEVANGKIYPESAMTVGDLDQDAAADAGSMLVDALASYPDTVVEGHSYVKVFYMPDNDDDCFTKNGIFNTFTVTAPESGSADFCIIYDRSEGGGTGDFVRVEEEGNVNVVFDTVGATFTVAGSEPECQHPTTEEVVTKNPTCTETGLKNIVCSDCKEVLQADVEVPKLGHNYVPTVTDPTCTEDGYTTYQCSRCPSSYKADYTDKLGHDWDEGVVTKPATEDEEGEMTYTCKRCPATRTEPIPVLGHTHDFRFVENIPATCMDGGYDLYECRCSATEQRNAVAALGHSITVKVDSECVAPTCEIDGYDVYKCVRCEERENRTVTHLGHLAGEWQTVTPATETAEGLRVKYCVREGCGIELEREVIPVLSFISKVSAKENIKTLYFSGDEIEITSMPNDEYVKFAIAFAEGCTVTATGAEVVSSGSTFKVLTVADTVNTATITVTDSTGNFKEYTVNVTFDTLTYESYITKVSSKKNAVQVGLEGEVINVKSKPNADYVEIAILFESENLRLSGDGYTFVSGGRDFAIFDIEKGTAKTELTLSDVYGNSKTFTVSVVFDEISYESYITKLSAKHKISSISLDEDVINVTARDGETYVEFAFLFESENLNLSGEGYTFVSGGRDFAVIDVTKGTEKTELTLSDVYGNSKTFTVNVNFGG